MKRCVRKFDWHIMCCFVFFVRTSCKAYCSLTPLIQIVILSYSPNIIQLDTTSQTGLRDLGDGLGLQPIEDLSVAQKILEKVNEMNIDTGRDCLVAAAVFAALPDDITKPAAALAAVAAGAYLYLNNSAEEGK